MFGTSLWITTHTVLHMVRMAMHVSFWARVTVAVGSTAISLYLFLIDGGKSAAPSMIRTFRYYKLVHSQEAQKGLRRAGI